MVQNSLEIKVRVKPNRSIIRNLIDDAAWLSLYSQSESLDELPEAQRCRMKFEHMDLPTRFYIYRALRREAKNAVEQVNLKAAKLYNERASYLWENYIVLSKKT